MSRLEAPRRSYISPFRLEHLMSSLLLLALTASTLIPRANAAALPIPGRGDFTPTPAHREKPANSWSPTSSPERYPTSSPERSPSSTPDRSPTDLLHHHSFRTSNNRLASSSSSIRTADNRLPSSSSSWLAGLHITSKASRARPSAPPPSLPPEYSATGQRSGAIVHELRGSNGHHVTLHTDPGVHLHTLQDKGATKHLAFEKPGTTAPRHIFWKPARGGATETHISWDPRVHHMQLPEYRAEHAGRVTYSLGMQGQGGEHSQALGLGQSQSARPHRGQVQHEVHGQGQHHGQGQSHYSQIQDQIQGQGQGQVLAAPEPARKKRAVLDRIRSRGGGAGSGGARGLLGRWKTGGWM